MWCWIRCRSAPDSREAEWKDQPGVAGWGNASRITRLLPPTSTYYLIQCRYEISLPLISIIRLLPPTTRYTRLTTHVRGLLYFTNYYIHDYKTLRSTPRLYQFASARLGGFIGQGAAYMDLVHQQIKPEKGFKEVTESNKVKTTTREDTVLEEGISGRICQHCTTRD
jgi:hypothetical protein